MLISSDRNNALIYGIIRTEIAESYVSALLAIGYSCLPWVTEGANWNIALSR
jgi:hypothetical protein